MLMRRNVIQQRKQSTRSNVLLTMKRNAMDTRQDMKDKLVMKNANKFLKKIANKFLLKFLTKNAKMSPKKNASRFPLKSQKRNATTILKRIATSCPTQAASKKPRRCAEIFPKAISRELHRKPVKKSPEKNAWRFKTQNKYTTSNPRRCARNARPQLSSPLRINSSKR